MIYDNAVDLLHFEYVEDQRKLKKSKLISTLDQSTDKASAYKKIIALLKDDCDENEIGYNYLDYIEGNNTENDLITRHMHVNHLMMDKNENDINHLSNDLLNKDINTFLRRV